LFNPEPAATAENRGKNHHCWLWAKQNIAQLEKPIGPAKDGRFGLPGNRQTALSTTPIFR
jgi:hypothetical protein